MSKYVRKNHGLVVGSDNVFFIVGDGELRDDYRAIVSFHGYDFDQHNTANCVIRTPAQQLCLEPVKIDIPRSFEGISWIDHETRYKPTNWANYWLETNVGAYQDKWDTYSTNAKGSARPTLFFKRRTDALAFVNMVDHILAGIKFSDYH